MNEPDMELRGPARSARVRSHEIPVADPRAHELLRGSSEAVLERLTQGDPLELVLRVRRYLHSRRFLMDEQQIALATAALIARNSPRYRARPSIDRWIERQIEACAEAQRFGEGERGSAELPVGRRWAQLAERFHLSPEDLDVACRKFHGLTFESRDAFFRLVLERRPIESLVHRGGRQAPEIAKQARQALGYFMHLQPNRVQRHGPSG